MGIGSGSYPNVKAANEGGQHLWGVGGLGGLRVPLV